MFRRRAVTIILVCISVTAHADAIDDFVRERLRQLHLPGVAVAVVRDGKPVTTRTYGYANLELDVPVTEDTVFELGSLSKQFTAVAVMMLVEEGRIDLDASIAHYLPEAPERWRAITVRHLLTHSSGIQEYLSIPGFMDEAHAADHKGMTRLFFDRLQLEFAPGETWSYSNSGYLLLGDIVERVSGKSYWELLRQRIFTPLGMTATRSSEPRALIRNRAAGYGWREGTYENRPALSENAYAAGAIASTIRDMTRWEAALHEGKLLTKSSFAQIWTPLTVRAGGPPPFPYGFGWVVDVDAVLHSGGTPGFSSAIRRYREKGLTVIVLANHGDRILDHLPLEIAGIVDPVVARRSSSDPDPQLSRRLTQALRDLLAGKADPSLFTPAMQRFLTTANGRGLWEWIGSHGALTSMTYTRAEPAGESSVLRYKATLGDAGVWFSFSVTKEGKIAQIYWW